MCCHRAYLVAPNIKILFPPKPISMTTKLPLWTVLGLFCLACCFSGCQSSKIAYGNSYYFKQAPKSVAKAQPSDKVATVTPNKPALSASLGKSTVAEEAVTNRLTEAREQLATVIEESNSPTLKASVARTERLAKEMKSEQLTKKEARAKRKELRQELRTLRKEFRHAAPDATNEMHRYLRLSLILWGAAIVISIIAAVTVAPVISILAGLAGLAGTIFFILWLIDEFG